MTLAAGKQSKSPSNQQQAEPTRFSVLNQLIDVDAEINGAEYVDVFEKFTYSEAQ